MAVHAKSQPNIDRDGMYNQEYCNRQACQISDIKLSRRHLRFLKSFPLFHIKMKNVMEKIIQAENLQKSIPETNECLTMCITFKSCGTYWYWSNDTDHYEASHLVISCPYRVCIIIILHLTICILSIISDLYSH